jgi:citrate synthase
MTLRSPGATSDDTVGGGTAGIGTAGDGSAGVGTAGAVSGEGPVGVETVGVDEAARRLGVKRETVYAYTSRGLLRRHGSSTRRATRFGLADVEALAGRARRTDRSVAVDVVVQTELTALDPAGRLAYRGRDAVGLARHAGFERTAALLWGAADEGAGEPWRAGPDALCAVRAAVAPLADADPSTLLAVVVAVLRAGDPFRADRRPAAVRRAARTIVAAFVDGLPGAGRAADDRIASRLWAVLAPDDRRPGPRQLQALDAALVLLADHELAASTFAARVAASAWADPYAVVLAGLGPLGGALHGTAGTEVERRLRAFAAEAGDRELADWLADPAPAGFGHRVYRGRDPRADHLLGLLPGCAADDGAARAAAEVVRLAAERGLPAPNVDLGLAALTTAMGLRPGAAATVFALARTAGLVAHGLEEYPHRLRFRPRATYVGPAAPGR